MHKIKKLGLTGLLVTLALGSAISQAVPLPFKLAMALVRPEAQAVLTETQQGIALSERLFGQSLVGLSERDRLATCARWAGDLHGERAVSRNAEELYLRIEFLNEDAVGFGIKEARGNFSKSQRRFLESWAKDHLSTEVISRDAFRFVSAPKRMRDFKAERARFLGVIPVGPTPAVVPDLATNALARMVLPAEAWQGTIQDRLARLVIKWPKQVASVDGVTFRFVGGATQSRKVLVISHNGLSSEQSAQLTEDYLNAVARGTLSFPMGPMGDHLYTRIGTHSVDFLETLRFRPYEFRGRERLEPLLALSQEEQVRVLEYMNRGRLDPSQVIGKFDYYGVTSGSTRGRLDDNRSIPGEGVAHNCTSWICTAPVGAQDQTLFSLAGAHAAQELHTGPGWWTYYLTSSAPAERIPAVVYSPSSQEPLSSVLRRIVPGGKFPDWEFRR